MRSFLRLGLVLGSVFLGAGVALGQAKLGLHVVDANGQKVGYVLDPSDAAVFINGEAFSMEMDQSGFRATQFVVYSVAGDCSAPLYVAMYDGQSFGLYSRAWYTSDGVFHYPSTPDAQPVLAGSAQTIGPDGVPGPCGTVTGGLLGAPVLTAAPPTLTPPVRVVDALAVSPAPATATFNDVPTTHPFFKFIEALKASGITGGCSAAPPLYCPDSPVTRGQMAVFLSIALGL